VELEHLLLEAPVASYIESAMALSDAYENGLIGDLTCFKTASLAMASDIGGKPVVELSPVCHGQGLPTVLEIAFNALISGTRERLNP